MRGGREELRSDRAGPPRPLPRPGYDEDGRLRQLEDDPRYFRGAQLGKAQLAALGKTGLGGANTASFYAESTLVRPSMRVYYGGASDGGAEVTVRHDDLMVVPDFFCGEDDFRPLARLVAEVEQLRQDGTCNAQELRSLPGCSAAVGQVCVHLGIDRSTVAVKLCWYSNGPREPSIVHEFGSFPHKPTDAGPNFLALLTVGDAEEMAFRRSGSRERLFFPMCNGALTVIGCEVWRRWVIGMNTHPADTQGRRRGHLCLVIAGRCPRMTADLVLGPVPSDALLQDPFAGCLGMPAGDCPRPDMRVITVPRRERYGRQVRHDDVIVVPEFFCKEDDWETYYKLIREMRDSQEKGDRKSEWLSWHEGAHLLSQNPTGSPTYNRVVEQMCKYFAVAEGNRGTRFNWYRDGSDWKPFHHDSAAFNPMRAKTQNCTIGISFGAPRELGFRHAQTGELVYFPQKNGMLFYFGRDSNIVWQHGLNALPCQEQDGKGRVSIILWGFCDAAVDEAGSPPMLSNDSRGKGKGKGKGKAKGSWGYDGRAKQTCRDFQRGQCSHGSQCRFAHEQG